MDTPDTRPSLLLRLRDARDQQAWNEFWRVYEPLVLRLVRRRGIQEADAREISQEVLVAVSRAIERYEADSTRGSFRGWLSTITRNLVVNFLIRQSRHPRGSGDSILQSWLESVPAPSDEESQFFDREEKLQLFRWAAEHVRGEFHETTWTAFWETAVNGRSPTDIARQLDVAVGVVYVSRSRVMKRLRETIEEFRR
ncbi:MAG: sigma-70 family RNA polymerase sigma factor [Pirellulales bacterium]